MVDVQLGLRQPGDETRAAATASTPTTAAIVSRPGFAPARSLLPASRERPTAKMTAVVIISAVMTHFCTRSISMRGLCRDPLRTVASGRSGAVDGCLDLRDHLAHARRGQLIPVDDDGGRAGDVGGGHRLLRGGEECAVLTLHRRTDVGVV